MTLSFYGGLSFYIPCSLFYLIEIILSKFCRQQIQSVLASSSSKGFPLAMDRGFWWWVPNSHSTYMHQILSHLLFTSLRVGMMKCYQNRSAFTRGTHPLVLCNESFFHQYILSPYTCANTSVQAVVCVHKMLVIIKNLHSHHLLHVN